MRALFLNLAIHVAMRALAILAACVALVSACSSNPKTTAGPVAADGPPIGLYARLVKQNGLYTVTGICWPQSVNLAPGVSKYPRCPEPVNKEGAFYFNFTTLTPPGTSFAVCSSGSGNGQKSPPACDEYKEIHEADVATNVVTSPLIAIGAVLSFGREISSMVKLDEEAFKREIERALPTPRRLAMIEEERAWRQGAPARAQLVAQQQRSQAEAARLDQRARTQEFRARVQTANRAAEQQFQAAASAVKGVGASVCSADNRLAFVEQISGTRIRLQLYGVAVARWSALDNANPLGPFAVDRSTVEFVLPSELDSQGIELPVTDRFYLFKPHTTVQIQPYTGSGNVLWDESRFWGTCDWRV
jgi:hypothetical protein